MKPFDFIGLGRDAAFRSAPFWAWNGKLAPAEIRRQVRIMNTMKMGGFFMHSRNGLATEYLGKEWFDCVHAAVDEARKLGMKAYLYDEDRWPSGAAGGLITQEKRFRMRYLEHYAPEETVPGDPEDVTEVGLFALKTAPGGTVAEYRRVAPGEPAAPGWELRRFVVRTAASEGRYNGGAYLDTMDPDAVKAFLDSTHERYWQECGNDFGSVIPAIFTDEPNYLDLIARNRRPWSAHFAKRYREEYGSDLLAVLPELFFPCGKTFSTARYRYYRLLTKLFTENFLKALGEWCASHRLELTGHLLREDTLTQQIMAVGAAMPGYEFMQMPGIDLLTERWLVCNTVKQVASVARQLGRKRVLSETYGCTGWDFPLSGHKALGDWQFALGVNFRCQHLYWYTMRGAAKRDYPASIGGQSPWYAVHGALEDYFARLGELLSECTVPTRLLVLHPVETMWGYAADYGKDGSFAPAYDREFARLANHLIGNHLEFDYGDESLLAKYGAAEAGLLRVGEVRYDRVLLPEIATLRRSTAQLLAEFAARGGKVDCLGEVPQFLDGMPDEAGELAALYRNFRRLDGGDCAARLKAELGGVFVTLPGGREATALLTRVGEVNTRITVIFAVNLGCELPDVPTQAPWLEDRKLALDGLDFRIAAPAGRVVAELDLRSGKLRAVNAVRDAEFYRWQADFAPQESRCFVIGEAAALPEVAAETTHSGAIAVPLRSFPALPDEPNLLVLDRARAKIGSDPATAETSILEVDKLVRQRLGLRLRGGDAEQPWFRRPDPARHLAVTLEYAFFCETVPTAPSALILESPELFTIELNGRRIESRSDGFWCDPALEKIAVAPELFRTGRNELRLALEYRDGFAGLEAVCLAGDFGVRAETTLTAPAPVRAGRPLTEQGWGFYAGNLTYPFEFELAQAGRGLLAFAAWRGTALGVRWDDGEECVLFGAPWRSLSPCELAPGKHRMTVTVYGSRRNALGPFYCKERYAWIGPYEFERRDTAQKQLADWGLSELPELTLLRGAQA